MECFQTNINRFLPETTFCSKAFAKGKEVLQACQTSEKTVKGLKLVSSLVATLIGNEKYKYKYMKCLRNSRLKYHMVEISHIITIAAMLETMNNKLEMKNTNASTKYKYKKCLRNSGLKYHMVSGMVATVIRNSLRCHKCITSDQSWGRTKRPSSSWSSSLWSSSSSPCSP